MPNESAGIDIPIIDIGGFLNGNAREKCEIANLVDSANRDVGFLLITGHNSPRSCVEKTFEISRSFFESSESSKLTVLARDGEQHGYHQLGKSGLAAKEGKTAPPDIREYFMAGRLSLEEPYFNEDRARLFYRPNRWPTWPKGFQETISRYYTEMDGLGQKLMQLFGMSLGVGEDYFTDKIDRHFGILSSIYYPVQKTAAKPGQLRAGAHTDYGALTILAPSNAPGGLEVLDKSGQWQPVPYIPEAFVINIGDMMQRWTNEHWTSNMHRVVNPPVSAVASRPRQSLAFFLHPNYDALVEAIPGTVARGQSPIHPPIRAGDYMREKEAQIASAKPKA
ncbi:MAG: 2OG-Fe(II) oxygenase family protein [Pseudomonadota bacterium]|nr:2OG-Fe(II) oxygenase family protein [Pseudomonadota bacterium]